MKRSSFIFFLSLALALQVACSKQINPPSSASTNTPLIPSPTRLVLSDGTLNPQVGDPVYTSQVISAGNAHLLAEVRRLTGHDTGIITSLAFSPDGSLLATAGDAGSEGANIYLWNPANGELVATLTGHGSNINQLAFSPDGKLLASASSDATVRLWDPATFESLSVLQNHTDEILSVAFSQDGLWLASGGLDGQAILWDLQHLSSTTSLTHSGVVSSVAFSPDSTTLATTQAEGSFEITLWSVPETDIIKTIPMPDRVRQLAFSPDGRMLAAAMQSRADPTIHLLLPGTGQTSFILSGAHASELNGVFFSPDGRLVASASEDTTLAVWDAWTGVLLVKLHHDSSVNSVAFSPDGSLLASAGSDGTVRLWAVPPAQVPPIGLTQTAAVQPGFTSTPSRDTVATPGCDLGFSRLEVGQVAVVAPGDLPLRIRSEPLLDDSNILTLISAGVSGLITDGPVCVEGLVFWKIENETIPGGSGWAAEGDGSDYWLEPYNP